MAFQGVCNDHRRLTSKILRGVIDLHPSPIPELRTKVIHITYLIRGSAAEIHSRVTELAASGYRLHQEIEDQVKKPNLCNYTLLILFISSNNKPNSGRLSISRRTTRAHGRKLTYVPSHIFKPTIPLTTQIPIFSGKMTLHWQYTKPKGFEDIYPPHQLP